MALEQYRYVLQKSTHVPCMRRTRAVVDQGCTRCKHSLTKYTNRVFLVFTTPPKRIPYLCIHWQSCLPSEPEAGFQPSLRRRAARLKISCLSTQWCSGIGNLTDFLRWKWCSPQVACDGLRGVSECGKIAEGRQDPIWKDRERSVSLPGILDVHHVDEYLWCRGASPSVLKRGSV